MSCNSQCAKNYVAEKTSHRQINLIISGFSTVEFSDSNMYCKSQRGAIVACFIMLFNHGASFGERRWGT